jgi:Rieske Fe-S protein
MNRRDFIINSCVTCFSITAFSGLLSSCRSVHYTEGRLTKEGITVGMNEFVYFKKDKQMIRPYIIVRNEKLKYPICVYRYNENEYTALWMRCTHQGSELQVSGTHLYCPAHGSEFTDKGQVTNGPADKNLLTFPVSINNNELFIDLKK